jgi:transcriptional regulator with XRE-family HTH domain
MVEKAGHRPIPQNHLKLGIYHMALAAKLKELRLKKGKSLQDVADAVGASKAHIWDLETARAINPTLELLRKLSNFFGTSIADLIGEDPSDATADPQVIAMYRDLKTLDDDDQQTIRLMMERLKKRKD